MTPSTYVVTATVKGFEPSRREVTINDEEVVTVDFCLRQAVGTGTIRGRVLDSSSGTPISTGGAVVLILPLGNRYASLNGDGYYEFRDLPADNYELWASVPSCEDEKVTVALGDGETKTADFQCVRSKRVEPPWG